MQSWEIKRSKCSSPKVGDLGWTNTKVEWSGPKQIQISINWTVLYQKQYGNSDWRKETYWCCQWCLRAAMTWGGSLYDQKLSIDHNWQCRWRQWWKVAPRGGSKEETLVGFLLFGSCRQWDCRLMVTSVWCRWWDRPLQRWLTGDAL